MSTSFPLILSMVSVLGVIGVGVVVFLVWQRMQRLSEPQQDNTEVLVQTLHERVDRLNQSMSETMQNVTNLVLKQLNENTKQVDHRLHSSHTDWQRSAHEIRTAMQGNETTIREVTGKLAQMEEANKRIFEVGKDISSLQEILRAPKLRGSLGELFLGELLAQTFPKEQYSLQYAFRNGEVVDAIVRLRDGVLVAIDAKFPLESFKRMLEAPDAEAKKFAQREFVKSIKQRVDEVCQKYIVPDEGTLDFALMYVPAENVYYETVVKGEIDYGVSEYCYSKRVIPVSPNNLYVYLQTIVLGLRGMQIEERAKDILQDLGRLQGEFTKVSDSYEVMGKHLMSAVGRYQDTQKLMHNFDSRVKKIESETHAEEIAPPQPNTLPDVG